MFEFILVFVIFAVILAVRKISEAREKRRQERMKCRMAVNVPDPPEESSLWKKIREGLSKYTPKTSSFRIGNTVLWVLFLASFLLILWWIWEIKIFPELPPKAQEALGTTWDQVWDTVFDVPWYILFLMTVAVITGIFLLLRRKRRQCRPERSTDSGIDEKKKRSWNKQDAQDAREAREKRILALLRLLGAAVAIGMVGFFVWAHADLQRWVVTVEFIEHAHIDVQDMEELVFLAIGISAFLGLVFFFLGGEREKFWALAFLFGAGALAFLWWIGTPIPLEFILFAIFAGGILLAFQSWMGLPLLIAGGVLVTPLILHLLQ